MIEITNNRVKCDMGIGSESEVEYGEEQALAFQEVAEAIHRAKELYEQYKLKYGTDRRGIDRVLRSLNGGIIYEDFQR